MVRGSLPLGHHVTAAPSSCRTSTYKEERMTELETEIQLLCMMWKQRNMAKWESNHFKKSILFLNDVTYFVFTHLVLRNLHSGGMRETVTSLPNGKQDYFSFFFHQIFLLWCWRHIPRWICWNSSSKCQSVARGTWDSIFTHGQPPESLTPFPLSVSGMCWRRLSSGLTSIICARFWQNINAILDENKLCIGLWKWCQVECAP